MSAVLHCIGDVAEQVRGVTYKKQDASTVYIDGYLPVLRAGNIAEDGIVFHDLVYVPRSCVKPKQMIRKGDIVVAASSGSLSVVGKAALARDDFDGSFGAFCKVIRPSEKVDASYIAHYFRTAAYRRRVSTLAQGANINNLRSEDLNSLSIRLPSFSEQRRIASILDAADALRAKQRESIAQLDALVQSTFLEMFGDPARNSMEWPSVELSAVVASGDRINYGVVQPGGHYPAGRPLIRVGDIMGGELAVQRVKLIDPLIEAKYARSRLNGTELLISCVGSIGSVSLVPDDAVGFNIARAVARIPLCEQVDRVFMLHCLRSNAVQRHFEKETRTVSQPTLNIGLIKTAPVVQPPLRLQKRFADIACAVEAERSRLRTHLTELDTLFASLQSRAFAGEL